MIVYWFKILLKVKVSDIKKKKNKKIIKLGIIKKCEMNSINNK